MEIVKADAMGWCFGVRDAVTMALEHPHRGDLTVVGELVHDETVLASLAAAGVRVVRGFDEPVRTTHALVTAHGASQAAVLGLQARGLQVSDATCPLVRRAHGRLARLVAEGRHPVVVGRRGHVEVLGLIGDHAEASVVEGPADVGGVPDRPAYGVVAQTTQPLDHVLETVEALRKAKPSANVRFLDTICHPTKERQLAVRRLAAQVDRVVVVGGPRSHNTARLAEACQEAGTPADRVQRPDELDPALYRDLERVGVTAGTSCPDEAVEAVVEWLRGLEPTTTRAAAVVTSASA